MFSTMWGFPFLEHRSQTLEPIRMKNENLASKCGGNIFLTLSLYPDTAWEFQFGIGFFFFFFLKQGKKFYFLNSYSLFSGICPGSKPSPINVRFMMCLLWMEIQAEEGVGSLVAGSLHRFQIVRTERNNPIKIMSFHVAIQGK